MSADLDTAPPPGSCFLADLRAEVKRRGAKQVAKDADVDVKVVRRFLRDPESIRISTFSRLCRAVDMPHGDFHLIDQHTGRCTTCNGPPAAHYPLFAPGGASNAG